jgi:hypothetical protein
MPVTHDQHPVSDRHKVTRTQPIMQLMYPRRACIFYRGIEGGDLVLYTYLVYDRLQCHVAFQELSAAISSPSIYASEIKSDLFLLEPFIPPPFAEHLSDRRISSRIPIVGAIELGTPDFDDVYKTL